MQTLRNTQTITGLALTWFVLFLAVSVLTSLVRPASLQSVCTGIGIMKIVIAEDESGQAETIAKGMDCPMCSAVVAPPPSASLPHASPSPLAHALQRIASAHIASVTAPPMPSRGPPALLL